MAFTKDEMERIKKAVWDYYGEDNCYNPEAEQIISGVFFVLKDVPAKLFSQITNAATDYYFAEQKLEEHREKVIALLAKAKAAREAKKAKT